MMNTRASIIVFGVILGLLWPVNALADFAVPSGFMDQPAVGGAPALTAIDWLSNAVA